MILNLDLNPYINKISYVDRLNLGLNLKSDFSDYTPGGNIVISRLLAAFGEDSLSTGFLGGLNGERYHSMLLNQGLAHDFIQIQAETKMKFHISDLEDNYIRVIDEEPRLAREDLKKFLNLYKNLIAGSEVICGSSDILPLGLADTIYFQLVSIAKQNRKKFILTARGEELKKGIEAGPYMVIIDKPILEDLTNLYLEGENDIIRASNYILHGDVDFLVIYLPKDGIIILGHEMGYRVTGPSEEDDRRKSDLRRISAGFALGISRNYDLDMTLRLAYAFSSYDTAYNMQEIDLGEIKKIMGEVEISPLNYI